MTTETTDPLETVMAAADYYADMDADLQWTLLDDPTYAATLKDREEARERLRLHVQLALAKARSKQQTIIENLEHLRMSEGTDNGDWSDDYQFVIPLSAIEAEGDKLRPEIAALEARLQGA